MRASVVLFFCCACATPSRTQAWLGDEVRGRTRHALAGAFADGAPPLPPGVNADDGLDENEAAAIALWRSPALGADLTSFDSALADLAEAGRLPNPRFNFLAPIDPRQLALILLWPIDAIWQTPLRTAAANRELERTADAVVQGVLDTERDVRVAHAEAVLAHARVPIREELSTAWAQSAALAESRARAGDISPAEAAAVRAEATLAVDAIARARHDAEAADARLLALIGGPWAALPRVVAAVPLGAGFARPQLVALAQQHRPDLRSAELAIHAGAARVSWERSRVANLTASIDGQALRAELTPNFSPGLQLELPVFNQNQGGVGRADASVTRAIRRYAALQLSVTAETVMAFEGLERSRASVIAYGQVLSALDDAGRAARSSFESGAESYLVVIDALRRVTDAKLRKVELDAERSRAEAELARAVGGRTFLETL